MKFPIILAYDVSCSSRFLPWLFRRHRLVPIGLVDAGPNGQQADCTTLGPVYRAGAPCPSCGRERHYVLATEPAALGALPTARATVIAESGTELERYRYSQGQRFCLDTPLGCPMGGRFMDLGGRDACVLCYSNGLCADISGTLGSFLY